MIPAAPLILGASSSESDEVASFLGALAFGLLLFWWGWRVYTGKSREIVTEGQWAGPIFSGFAFAWVGAGITLVAVGVLLDAAFPGGAGHLVAKALMYPGIGLCSLGTIFMFYLPKRLRPAWFHEYRRQEREENERQKRADRLNRELKKRYERGELRRQLVIPSDEVDPSGKLPPMLPVWVGLGAPVSSSRIAPEVSKLRRPKLALAGRMTGDLPYLELRPQARDGMLWVAPDKLVFVQSDQDDRRHDESYVFEVPAASLVDLAPTRTPAGRPAIELLAVPETLVFELDGGSDPEAVVAQVRAVMRRFDT